MSLAQSPLGDVHSRDESSDVVQMATSTTKLTLFHTQFVRFARHRSEWARYVDGSDVVIFVVDVSDPSKLPTAQAELSVLLANDAINHIPFLILGNKIDVNPHLNEVELIQGLLLTDVVKTPWIVMPISAIKSVGIESVIEWLVNVGKNT